MRVNDMWTQAYYIAVERTFAASDDALIVYEVLKLIQPTWFTNPLSNAEAETKQLFENLRLIQAAFKDPIGESLSRYVKKNDPPFLLIRDFFNEHKARTILENREEFEQKLSELAHSRYMFIGAKVRRAVVRSIIYIFLTKMIFAFALEAPVDMFITKKVEYLALAINAIFPPILLFLVAGFTKPPGHDNTHKLMLNILTEVVATLIR